MRDLVLVWWVFVACLWKQKETNAARRDEHFCLALLAQVLPPEVDAWHAGLLLTVYATTIIIAFDSKDGLQREREGMSDAGRRRGACRWLL